MLSFNVDYQIEELELKMKRLMNQRTAKENHLESENKKTDKKENLIQNLHDSISQIDLMILSYTEALSLLRELSVVEENQKIILNKCIRLEEEKLKC